MAVVITPQLGSEISRLQPIEVVVSPPAPIVIDVHFGDGSSERVWNGASFDALYQGTSAQVTAGHYVLRRRGGWKTSRVDIVTGDPDEEIEFDQALVTVL